MRKYIVGRHFTIVMKAKYSFLEVSILWKAVIIDILTYADVIASGRGNFDDDDEDDIDSYDVDNDNDNNKYVHYYRYNYRFLLVARSYPRYTKLLEVFFLSTPNTVKSINLGNVGQH